MARTFEQDLDLNNDPLQVIGRFRGESDRLLLHKRDPFRITGVVRVHPRPIAVVDPADPTYPFVSNAARAAAVGPDGRFRITTPDLKQDDGVTIKGNLYMLDWDPQLPPPERPGPHFKVFP
jgi:hypothetical protein